jgi:hypothetical protein
VDGRCGCFWPFVLLCPADKVVLLVKRASFDSDMGKLGVDPHLCVIPLSPCKFTSMYEPEVHNYPRTRKAVSKNGLSTAKNPASEKYIQPRSPKLPNQLPAHRLKYNICEVRNQVCPLPFVFSGLRP